MLYSNSFQYIRIHFLAGIHPIDENWNEQLWEVTYCSNLSVAAEECGKVRDHVILVIAIATGHL